MINIISPNSNAIIQQLPISETTPLLTQQTIQQRLLLAQMGITEWVGQHQPVQSFVPEHLLGSAPAFHEVTTVDDRLTLPVEPDLANVQKSTFDNLPKSVSTTLTPITQERSNISTLSSEPVYALTPVRCHYYAIKVQEWVIVADASFLASHPQALQLWQNICHAFSTLPVSFKFPLIETHPNIALNNPILLLQASFSGFLCAMGRASHFDTHQARVMTATTTSNHAYQDSQKVGIVTPITECLAQETIVRLPYITEMLEDYRQKRQFWHLIIANKG